MADYQKEQISIIYEDEWLLVLDKPSGFVTTRENQKSKNNEISYVEEWLKVFYPNRLTREGIVHRLDRGTSGILVVARNNQSLIELKRQFKERQVSKRYQALTTGDLPGEGNIKMPIARSNYLFSKYKVRENGKAAETVFKKLRTIEIKGKKYTLIEVDLKTGRTHQIRVHLTYLGWPIVGDRLYGGEMEIGLLRPFLHAYMLTINHPKTGKRMVFNSKLAIDLQNLLDTYEKNR